MPKFPKPFFRRDRGRDRGWFVQIGKQQIKLAGGPENKNTEAAASKRYHEVMTEAGRDKSAKPTADLDALTVAEVFDKYLRLGTEASQAAHLRVVSRSHPELRGLAQRRGQNAGAIPEAIPHYRVGRHSTPDWSNAYRRGAIVAIQRPFNWAEELGYISGSPVKKIKKPQPQRRDTHIGPDEFTEIVAHYPEGDPFRDLILFAWTSGCRPQEAGQIEARHVDLETECIIIPKEEAKGKRRVRIIHLHGPALEIVTRLLAMRPRQTVRQRGRKALETLRHR